jgi:hypothetical protein
MNQTINVQQLGTEKEAKANFKTQFANYLAQQTESTLATHRWMKRLEAAGIGIILAAFLAALYVSINWKSVDVLMIPVAWFAFAASVAPALICYGLDAIFLLAFPPTGILGTPMKLVTGSGAVWIGFGFILLALVAVAFWGLFAFATLTQNWALLQPLIGGLGVVMGLGMAISILVAMAQKVFKMH